MLDRRGISALSKLSNFQHRLPSRLAVHQYIILVKSPVDSVYLDGTTITQLVVTKTYVLHWSQRIVASSLFLLARFFPVHDSWSYSFMGNIMIALYDIHHFTSSGNL